MTKRKSLSVILISAFISLLLPTTVFGFSFGSLFNIFHSQKPKHQHVAAPANPHQKPPTHVKVGVYLLHVGKYDLQSASTRMDFYLIFKCKPLCSAMNFEIMNATDANIRLAAKQQDSLIYRVQADLNKSGNLHNYPFDSHALNIVLEDRQMTSDKMIFEVDPTTTDLDSNLNVVGFDILPRWVAHVSNHFYSVFQQTFSSYQFSIFIKRPLLAGFLKGILPALIIISCSFLALMMHIEHASSRLGLATSTLIAAEVFHLNLTASLPPLGYITYADMFMFINYLFLFVVLIEVVTTTYFINSQHRERAIYINQICAWGIPASWLILQIINWIFYNPTGIQNMPMS